MIKNHLSPLVKPKRAIIFGACGFVAQNLARHLAQIGVHHLAIGSAQIDLCQSNSIAKLHNIIEPEDAIIITSALTPEKGKDVRTFMKNISMIDHFCQFLESHRCAYVIYISSDAVFNEQSSLVNETTPLDASDLYGFMHIARERMLQYTLGKSKIPLCVIRPSAIYGAGDTHNSYGPNRFFRTAVKDHKITLFGNGEEKRDHINVNDFVRFLGLCLFHQSEGDINFASGNSISFYDLAQSIIKLCQYPVQLECLPRTSLIRHRHFDTSLRLKIFPDFYSTSLEKGLAEMYQNVMQSGPEVKR